MATIVTSKGQVTIPKPVRDLLGITTGTRFSELDEIDEALAIAPMADGMAQLAGMLRAIDEGCCDA